MPTSPKWLDDIADLNQALLHAPIWTGFGHTWCFLPACEELILLLKSQRQTLAWRYNQICSAWKGNSRTRILPWPLSSCSHHSLCKPLWWFGCCFQQCDCCHGHRVSRRVSGERHFLLHQNHHLCMWGLNINLRKERVVSRGRQHPSCPNSNLLSSDAVVLDSSLKPWRRRKVPGCAKTSGPRDFHSNIELRASRRGKKERRGQGKREM